MTTTDTINQLFIWIVTSTVACFFSLGWISGTYIDGEFVPMGADSFYHAQRILTAVENIANYYQYDNRMHVPEGSIITWPWFYDLMVAIIVKLILFFVNTKPVNILIYVPTIGIFINTALIIGIAARLGLSKYLQFLAGLCFAFSPLTLAVHGVGNIDHHFAELSIVLAVLFSGIGWMKSPGKKAQALLFGVILGLGYGIHNGLFVLQIPLLLTITILWVTKNIPSNLNVKSFGIGFGITSLLLIVPSLAFRRGLFEFITLSWFHLYVSVCTLLYLFIICRMPFSPKNGLKVIVISILLAIPLLNEIIAGFSFIGSDIEGYARITETVGVVAMFSDPAWSLLRMSSFYSLLLWMMPITVYFAIRKISKASSISGYELYFWVYALFGLLFLIQQYRFHYFGSVALYMPILLIIQQWSNKQSVQFRKYYNAGITLIIVIAYVPTPSILFAKQPLALDADHRLYRPLYLKLADVCKKNPGTVLADSFDGHYITYYTDCSVISNNFLISQQHVEKLKVVNKLLSSDVSELLSQKFNIDYVFVRIFRRDQMSGNFPKDDLRRELLQIKPYEDQGIELIAESAHTANIGNKTVNIGRIYQIGTE